ncbi:MAG: hypothetical protein ACE5JJ_11985, partial [Nitrospinota bacterium]
MPGGRERGDLGMKSLLLRTFLVALLIGAGAGAAAAESPPLLVPAGIPNLRGLTPAEVMERLAPLEEKGTHFEVQWVLLRTSHPVYQKLHRRVIAQSVDRPRRGKGYVLTLTLALFQGAAEGVGPLPVGAVPKFVGLTRERAEKVLQNLAARGARFQVRWTGEGEIIQRQSIPPGKALFPGEQALTLALSIGVAPSRPAPGKRIPGSRALARPGEEEKSLTQATPRPEPRAVPSVAPPSARLTMPTLGGLRRAQVEIVLRSWAEKGVRFKPTWREERLAHPSFEAFDGKVYFQSVRPGTTLSPGEVPLVLHVARYIGPEPKRPIPLEPPQSRETQRSGAARQEALASPATGPERPEAREAQRSPAVRLKFFTSSAPGVPAGTRAERKRPLRSSPGSEGGLKGVGISPKAARPPTAKGAIALPAAEAKPTAKTPPTKSKKVPASGTPPAGR